MKAVRQVAAHIGPLWVLGLPLIGANISQFLTHVIDTIMMGRYGVDDLAAMVLASAGMFLILFVGVGFATSILPMIAESAAQKNTARVRQITRMALWLVTLYALIFLPMLYFSFALLVWLKQAPEIAVLAQNYLRIMCFGLPIFLAIAVLRNYLTALEHKNIIFWPTLLTLVLNAGLNWLLIFGNWGFPEMGIRGAAIASVLSQVFNLLIYALYIKRHLSQYKIFSRLCQPHFKVFGQVFRLGFPIGVTYLAENSLFLAATIMAGWFGATTLAAHGITFQTLGAAFMIPFGLSGAVTVLIGKSLAQNQYTILRHQAYAAITTAICSSLVCSTILLIFSEQLIDIFIGSDEPKRAAIIEIGVKLLFVAALLHLVDALQVIAFGLLRGLQDTKTPLFLAAFNYWAVGIPASYILGFTFGLGGVGIWIGLALGLACASVTLLTRFWKKTSRISASTQKQQS